MELLGTYDKLRVHAHELRHNDEVGGWQWPLGRWDPQTGRAVLLDDDTGRSLERGYVETDFGAIELVNECVYLVYRPLDG